MPISTSDLYFDASTTTDSSKIYCGGEEIGNNDYYSTSISTSKVEFTLPEDDSI